MLLHIGIFCGGILMGVILTLGSSFLVMWWRIRLAQVDPLEIEPEPEVPADIDISVVMTAEEWLERQRALRQQ